MHSGFKGTRIGLNRVAVAGNVINYEIAFIDSEGFTHGTIRHTEPLSDTESPIGKKVDELATLLINKAAAMHFERPAGTEVIPSTGGVRGIAEALGDTGVAADEPEGTPG